MLPSAARTKSPSISVVAGIAVQRERPPEDKIRVGREAVRPRRPRPAGLDVRGKSFPPIPGGRQHCRRLRQRAGKNAFHRSLRPFARGGENRTRSEEHTSELQSLMRISYAVFALTKKINL